MRKQSDASKLRDILENNRPGPLDQGLCGIQGDRGHMTACDPGLDPGWRRTAVNDVIWTTGERQICILCYIKYYMKFNFLSVVITVLGMLEKILIFRGYMLKYLGVQCHIHSQMAQLGEGESKGVSLSTNRAKCEQSVNLAEGYVVHCTFFFLNFSMSWNCFQNKNLGKNDLAL